MTNKEIERKFLVKNGSWTKDVRAFMDIVQAYLTNDGVKCIRIRKTESNGKTQHTMTIKSCNGGMTRMEIELELGRYQYTDLMKLVDTKVLRKKRYAVVNDQDLWFVDVFPDGLTIAEIELKTEGQVFERPDWLGEEVTDKKEYYNAEIAKRQKE